MYTENSNFLWEVESFNNNSTYVLQRSVVSDIIAQQLRGIHGYDYNSHLLKQTPFHILATLLKYGKTKLQVQLSGERGDFLPVNI